MTMHVSILTTDSLGSRWMAETIADALASHQTSVVAVPTTSTSGGSGPAQSLEPGLRITRRDELELERDLVNSPSDVLIVADGRLVATAVRQAPLATAVIGHRGGQPSDEPWDLADDVSDLPLPWTEDPWDRTDRHVTTVWADEEDQTNVESLIRLHASHAPVGQVLRILTTGRAIRSSRLLTDALGVHGSVEVHDLERASTDVRAYGARAVRLSSSTAIDGRLIASASRAGIDIFEFTGNSASDDLIAWLAASPGSPTPTPRPVPQPYERSWTEALARWAEDTSRRAARIDRLLTQPTPADRAWRAATIITQSPETGSIDPETSWLASSRNRRWAGLVHEVNDTILEPMATRVNLARTSEVLSASGCIHCLISTSDEAGRIAIPSDSARTCIAAVRSMSGPTPVYVESLDESGKVLARHPAPRLEPPAGTVALRVFQPIMTSGATLRYGNSLGCTIEWWTPADDRPGFVSPGQPSRHGSVLSTIAPDTNIDIAGVAVPTRDHLQSPTVDDVTFEIDAVWTWVDGSDPGWQAKMAEHLPGAAVSADGADASRFESHDELRFSMRSVAMYAPWIRHHYLVTDGHQPAWLSDVPNVSVIDHRDIIDHRYLPTFNSHAVENNLHHIAGLSEHFLYFNDDVFLGRASRPSDYFTPAGQPRAFRSPTGIPEGPIGEGDFGYYAARKNNRGIIGDRWGRTVARGYLHTPHALSRALLQRIEDDFAEPWQRTTAARFRSDTDIAVVSSLHHDLGKISGEVVGGSLRSKHVQIGTPESLEWFRRLLAQRHLDVFCLNETRHATLPSDVISSSLHAFMNAYFPVAAAWERSVDA